MRFLFYFSIKQLKWVRKNIEGRKFYYHDAIICVLIYEQETNAISSEFREKPIQFSFALFLLHRNYTYDSIT